MWIEGEILRKTDSQNTTLRSVSDASLFLRVFAFAVLVPFLLRLKLSRLGSLLEPRSIAPGSVEQIAAYVEMAIRSGRPLVRGGCLTRGLTRYYFLRQAGIDVSLCFGVTQAGAGHCWLEKDGRSLPRTRRPANPVCADVSHFPARSYDTDSCGNCPAMSIATLMREGKCTRDYNFHGVNLRVSCSSAMAACLDARFRMLPPQTEYAETVFFDFESVHDPKLHWLTKPQGRSRSFYELPHGEATYFEGRDEIYLCYADRVRAICHPGAGRAAFSVLETEPDNLWLASHLFFTISLIEILKRRGSVRSPCRWFARKR